MKTNICVSVFGRLAITLFFLAFGTAQSEANSKGPIITHSLAVETGKYAYVWKVYLEAEDPDGDMSKIASTVYQPGWGQYLADAILIKPQNRHHLRGYIQWNTFSSETPTLGAWTQITVMISIIDKAGNESNVVVFPFTFGPGVEHQYQYKLSPPFNKRDFPMLGHIDMNVFSPFMGPFDSPVFH